jgi:site-specific DNA-cytosine methylase
VGHETDFTIADFARIFVPQHRRRREIVAAREDQICSAFDHMGRQLVRYTLSNRQLRREFRSSASHAFDEVKSRLQSARAT